MSDEWGSDNPRRVRMSAALQTCVRTLSCFDAVRNVPKVFYLVLVTPDLLVLAASLLEPVTVCAVIAYFAYKAVQESGEALHVTSDVTPLQNTRVWFALRLFHLVVILLYVAVFAYQAATRALVPDAFENSGDVAQMFIYIALCFAELVCFVYYLPIVGMSFFFARAVTNDGSAGGGGGGGGDVQMSTVGTEVVNGGGGASDTGLRDSIGLVAGLCMSIAWCGLVYVLSGAAYALFGDGDDATEVLVLAVPLVLIATVALTLYAAGALLRVGTLLVIASAIALMSLLTVVLFGLYPMYLAWYPVGWNSVVVAFVATTVLYVFAASIVSSFAVAIHFAVSALQQTTQSVVQVHAAVDMFEDEEL